MFLLISYDINTENKKGKNRLIKIEKICSRYGIRKQKSVFEFFINQADYNNFLNEINGLITKEDSLRIYHLNKQQKIENFGKKDTLNFFNSFII